MKKMWLYIQIDHKENDMKNLIFHISIIIHYYCTITHLKHDEILNFLTSERPKELNPDDNIRVQLREE